MREALRRYAAGMGFADALHLALSAGEQQFMTFDKAFVSQARKMPLTSTFCWFDTITAAATLARTVIAHWNGMVLTDALTSHLRSALAMHPAS